MVNGPIEPVKEIFAIKSDMTEDEMKNFEK